MEWTRKEFVNQIKLAGSENPRIKERALKNLRNLRDTDRALYEKLNSDIKQERENYTPRQRHIADRAKA